VTGKTVRKWRDRYNAEGAAGLADRSSGPHHSPSRLSRGVEDEIEHLRRQRLSGPAIARRLRRRTVGVALRRRGLGRLASLDPKPPIIRYEREKPGELIHIDIKKLGRIEGIGHRITGDRTASYTVRWSPNPGQVAKRVAPLNGLNARVTDGECSQKARG
jgi:hypothetical protein